MKSNSILLIIVLFLRVLKIETKLMKNIRSTNNSTQQELDITEPSFFDPHTVTKYFMNQKPLTKNERKKLKSSGSKYNDDLFPNNYNSIEGKDLNGKFIDPNTKIEKATKLLEKDPKTGKKPEFKRLAEIFRRSWISYL